MNINNGYLYILQRNDKKGTNIYKIGMTEQPIFNRINKEASYRDCFVIETRAVNNGRNAENDLKNELRIKNIKRCKDVFENYQGIEDYIIDDINYVIKIFNDICDKNDNLLNNNTNTNNLTSSIENNTNELSNLKNNIFTNNFNQLIEKRKLLNQFIINDKQILLENWFNNFNKIFKPIEIIQGLQYSKNNSLKIFLIDTGEMYRTSHFNKTITITKFKNFISNICDYYYSKYGKITYKTEFNTNMTTSAQLYLIKPENVKILLNTDAILSKLNPSFTSQFIKIIQKYDIQDYYNLMQNGIKKYDKNIINYMKTENYSLIIDNEINEPTLNKSTKTITIKRNDFENFNNFKISFRYNPNITYELLTEFKILNENNCEDFILYQNNLDTLLRCLLNENNESINIIMEFMYKQIYVNNNCNNKLQATILKKKWIEEFEKKYKNILNLSNSIKEKIYTLLDEYIIINNKFKDLSMFKSCKI